MGLGKTEAHFGNGTSKRSRVGRIERFRRSSGAGSDRFGFRFAAIELAHDIGANAPERLPDRSFVNADYQSSPQVQNSDVSRLPD